MGINEINTWKESHMDLDRFVDCVDGGQALPLQMFYLLTVIYVDLHVKNISFVSPSHGWEGSPVCGRYILQSLQPDAIQSILMETKVSMFCGSSRTLGYASFSHKQ